MKTTVSAHERQLLNGYCSGALSEEEFEELEDALRNNPDLRKLLIEYREIESGLRNVVQSNEAETLTEFPSQKPNQRLLKWVEIYAVAATVVFLLSALFFTLGKNVSVDRENTYSGFAILTRESDAEWIEKEPQKGDSLDSGYWELESGIAEMEFFSGASVILEGPAKFEIVSGSEGVLHFGKLNADVPPHAYGFTIRSADVRLIDLGTAFAMECSEDGGTDVHVFEGKVELHDPKETNPSGIGEGDELLAGEGRSISEDGDIASINPDSSRFVRSFELDRLQDMEQVDHLEQWRDASTQLKKSSRTIAYYDFVASELKPRRLNNTSSLTAAELNGSIIGAQWTEGRWPGKQALEFKRPGDRVRITIPGKHDSLTLACWLRLDAFDQRFHSILHSDGWTRPGSLHWHINEAGFMAIGVWDGDNTRYNLSADLHFSPSDYGRWMHLAVTYNGPEQTVCLYRDGTLLKTIKTSHSTDLDIGEAEIGNWSHLNRGEGADLVRNFNGRIDEFMIIKEALSEDSIEALYRGEF